MNLEGGALESYAEKVLNWAESIASGAELSVTTSEESTKQPSQQQLQHFNKQRIVNALESRKRCSISGSSSREQASADMFLLEAYFMWNENELQRSLLKSGNISVYEGNKKLVGDFLLPMCNPEAEQKAKEECELNFKHIKTLEGNLDRERQQSESAALTLRKEANDLRAKAESALHELLVEKSSGEVTRRELVNLNTALAEAKETIEKSVNQLEMQRTVNKELTKKLEDLKEQQTHEILALKQKDQKLEAAMREDCEKSLKSIEDGYTRQLRALGDAQGTAEAAASKYSDLYMSLVKDVEEMEASHKKDMARLKEEHNSEVSTERNEANIKMQRMQTTFDFQIKQLNDEVSRAESIKLALEAKVLELKNKETEAEVQFEQKFQKVTDANERKLLTLSNHHEKQLTALKAEHSLQIRNLSSACDAESDKQREKSANYLERVKELQELLERLEHESKEQNSKIVRLAKEKEDQKRRADSGYGGLIKVHEKVVNNRSVNEIQKQLLDSIHEASMTADEHRKFLAYANTPREIGKGKPFSGI